MQLKNTNARSLLVATGNAGKIRELGSMLSEVPVALRGLNEFPGITEVEETGMTFDENARLKAAGYAFQAGIPAIADDSGLEVTALGGSPGIYSARYLSTDASFDERMYSLLNELEGTGSTDRSARFVCCVAVADGTGRIIRETIGVVNGSIAAEPRGSGGFGYDPIFIPAGFEATFGELDSAVKASISHRARALKEIIPFLHDFYRALT